MRPGPRGCATIIEATYPLTARPKPIGRVLAEVILREGWAQTLTEAQEVAEAWRDRTLSYLRAHLGAMRELGRPVRYDFNSSSNYMVEGASFIEPRDSPDVIAAKKRRAQRESYQQALGKLSPQDFEQLCKRVLDELGVEKARVTPYSKDEGIDFYGVLRLEKHIFPHDSYPSVQKQLRVWMVGQAKHCLHSKVSTPNIRELVGSVELAKGHAFSSRSDKYPDLTVKPCAPVFCLFFTTGAISLDGWKLLAASGVVGMDGEMLAAFLADRRVANTTGGFDEDVFSAWLRGRN